MSVCGPNVIRRVTIRADIMSGMRLVPAVAGVVVVGLLTGRASADVTEKASKISFKEKMQLPGGGSHRCVPFGCSGSDRVSSVYALVSLLFVELLRS